MQHDPQRASRLLKRDIELMEQKLAKLKEGEVEPLLTYDEPIEEVDTDDYWTEFLTFDPLFHDRTKLTDEEVAKIMSAQQGI